MLKQYYFDGINYSGFEIDKKVEDKISFVISKLLSGLISEGEYLTRLSIQATPGTEIQVRKPATEEFTVIGPGGVLEIDMSNVQQVTFGKNSPIFNGNVKNAFIRILADYGEGG